MDKPTMLEQLRLFIESLKRKDHSTNINRDDILNIIHSLSK